MSHLQNLIEELCPEGVNYVKVGDVAEIRKGAQLNKDILLESGEYPVLNGGKEYSGWWNEGNAPANCTTISQGGASAGFQWMSVPFWAGTHCFYLIDTSSIIDRFLFHCLKMNEFEFMNSQEGAGIPSFSKKMLSDFQIPLPPLPVQCEIVKILDNFTELTAELELRKKQYAYYREKLLAFDQAK